MCLPCHRTSWIKQRGYPAEVAAHGLGNAHLPEIEEHEALLQQIGRLLEQQRRAAESSAGAHRASK